MGKLFDVSLVFTSIPELLGKLPITLELAVLSMLLGLILGLVMAIIKMHKIKVLTQLTNLLISLLRGTPVIVQLYVAFFGIPMFFKAINQKFGTNLAVADIPGIAYAMIALGLNQAGFMAEIIRSALQSVDNGQIEAAHALGMTYPQALRRIILPEAFEVAASYTGKCPDQHYQRNITGLHLRSCGDYRTGPDYCRKNIPLFRGLRITCYYLLGNYLDY